MLQYGRFFIVNKVTKLQVVPLTEHCGKVILICLKTHRLFASLIFHLQRQWGKNWVNEIIFWWLSFILMLYMWYTYGYYLFYNLPEWTFNCFAHLQATASRKYHFEVHIHRIFAVKIPRKEHWLAYFYLR